MRRKIAFLFLLGMAISHSIIYAKENYEETYNMVRGREEGDKGNYNEAKEFFEKEIKEHPDNGYAYLNLAVIEYGNRQYDAIFPKLDKALKLIPKKDKDKQSLSYALRGETYLAMGDTLASLKDFSTGLSLNPDNDIILENLGDIYYAQGNYDESDKNYQRMTQLNPGEVQGYMGLGRNQYKRGNYEDAIKQYDKVVNMFSEYSKGYSFRADAKLQQGKYVEAADDIMKALDIDWDGKAHYLLSQFPDDKTSLVIAKLKGMAVKNPHDAMWPYYAAQVYKSKDNYNSAIEELNKAYDIDAHPVFLSMLTDCYQELGDFNKALEYVDKALELRPDDDTLIGTKGDILGEAGDTQGAIEIWSEYIDLNPDFFGGYYRRAFFEDNANMTDKALEDYDMAVTLDPSYAYAWLGKGDMHERKGEKDKAIAAYQKVVELDTVPEIGSSCAMYAYLALGQKEKAVEFMDKLIEKNPNYAGNYYEAACLYARMGDLDKSLANLARSMESGYHKFHHIMEDDDLADLRGTPGFMELMEQYRDKIDFSKLKTKPLENGEIPSIVDSINKVEIPFTPEGGCASVKCIINDLPLTFIFDTGASVVSMSQLEANFMLKNGYLKLSDFVGTGRFINANGEVSEDAIINLRNIEFGGLHLANVKASVVKNQKAPLLLGQTVLGRLGSIEIDNTNKKLIIKK